MENHPDIPIFQYPVLKHWTPRPFKKPAVNPELADLPAVERSAEVLRYSFRMLDWWLSRRGNLREWFRWNVLVSIILTIPALLIMPVVTFLLHQFVSWTDLIVEITKNLAVIPFLATLGTAILIGVVILLRLIVRR